MNIPPLASPRLPCGTRWGKEKSQRPEKFNKEKERSEKLKEIKARLNFGTCFGTSRYSESRTINTREHEERHRSRRSRSPRPSPSVFSRIRRERSRSPRQKSKKGGVFQRLGSRWKIVSARSYSYNQRSRPRYTEALSEVKTTEVGIGSQSQKKEIKWGRGRLVPAMGV
ncbi:hypothetical protein Tco_1386239 [Tanacetum coccineum]